LGYQSKASSKEGTKEEEKSQEIDCGQLGLIIKEHLSKFIVYIFHPYSMNIRNDTFKFIYTLISKIPNCI
jgi:hypothetical protein